MKAYIEPTIKIYEFDCDIKAVVLLLLHLLKKIAFTTNQKSAVPFLRHCTNYII